MEEHLLACPFCGQPAKIQEIHDTHPTDNQPYIAYQLGCSTKFCPGDIRARYPSRDKNLLIERWNKRAEDDED